ncbi:hypothetical protein ACMFMG_000236 [Clarireedia jacksonii]
MKRIEIQLNLRWAIKNSPDQVTKGQLNDSRHPDVQWRTCIAAFQCVSWKRFKKVSMRRKRRKEKRKEKQARRALRTELVRLSDSRDLGQGRLGAREPLLGKGKLLRVREDAALG